MKLIGLLWSITLCQALSAAPLSSLISRADAIVVGTESAPLQVGNTVSFNLNVERVFAGEIQVGSLVSVIWKLGKNVGLPDAASSYRGIWFLQKTNVGTWEYIPAGSTGNVEFFPDLSLPVSASPPPPELAYDPNGTALTDRILLEMAGGSPRSNPRMILGVVPDDSSPAAVRAFQYLAGSGSDEIALVGIAGLIQGGQTQGILAVEPRLSRLSAGVAGADLVASSIRLHFRSSDPAAIAALGRIATSAAASSLMQDSAAQALVTLHTASSVPWLGWLLSAPTLKMQLHGALGLSYFANGVDIPTPQTMPSLSHLNLSQRSSYRTPETEHHIGYSRGESAPFLQFWKTWWQQHPELHSSVVQ